MYLAVFFIFLAMFMIINIVMQIIFKDKIEIQKRIEELKVMDVAGNDNTYNQSFSERALKPIYHRLSKFLLKATPSNNLSVLSKKLDKAGLLKNNTTERWLFTKTMIIIIVSVMFGLLTYLIEPNIFKAVIISFIIMLFGNVLFSFYLARRVETRKKMIIKDLPYTLDLITVSVEAGLSFDGAMSRVIGNISGELCDEFAKSLKEIRMGIVRKVALKNMSERCNVRELTMLINSLIQADELGVSLGRVLRIEAANLREVRKQVAREKAMKAPIKMLFPLIFFIFPSVFIIILGPAAIKVYKVFFGG